MRADESLNVVDARPANATDRCYSDGGELIASGSTVWNGAWNGKDDGECMKRFPMYSNPRLVAGDDYAGDILKCKLRSVDAAIANGVYAPVDVTAQRDELKRVFPIGCVRLLARRCGATSGHSMTPPDAGNDNIVGADHNKGIPCTNVIGRTPWRTQPLR